MTPASEPETLVERVARTLMREAGGPDSDDWCSPAPWHEAARAAIEVVVEEAAKVADAYLFCSYSDQLVRGANEAKNDIAAAIRALAPKDQG